MGRPPASEPALNARHRFRRRLSKTRSNQPVSVARTFTFRGNVRPFRSEPDPILSRSFRNGLSPAAVACARECSFPPEGGASMQDVSSAYWNQNPPCGRPTRAQPTTSPDLHRGWATATLQALWSPRPARPKAQRRWAKVPRASWSAACSRTTTTTARRSQHRRLLLLLLLLLPPPPPLWTPHHHRIPACVGGSDPSE